MRQISYAFISGLHCLFFRLSPPQYPASNGTHADNNTEPDTDCHDQFGSLHSDIYPTAESLTIDPFSTPGFELEEGDLLLEDNFVESDVWSTGKMEAGSIAYGKNELSLGILVAGRVSLQPSKGPCIWMIFTLKSPSIQAYAEVRMNMESCFMSHPQWTSFGSGLIAPVKRAWTVSCLVLHHPHIRQLPAARSHQEHQAHRV